MFAKIFAAAVLVLSVSSASAGDYAAMPTVSYAVLTQDDLAKQNCRVENGEPVCDTSEAAKAMDDSLWTVQIIQRDTHGRRYFETSCAFDRTVGSSQTNYCLEKAWSVMAPLLDFDRQSDNPVDYAQARAAAAGLSEKLAILRKQVAGNTGAQAQVDQMIAFVPLIASGLDAWGEVLKIQVECANQKTQTCG